MTANQQAYAKEVQRIKRAVSRAEKRGYRFIENVVPQTPKRVTKQAVQRLKEITPNKIYDKALYLNEETGEVVSGLEGRKLERQESARKSAETRKRKQNKGKQKGKQEQYYPDGGVISFTNTLEQFIARISEPPQDFYVNRWGKKAKKYAETIEATERAKATLLSITYSAIDREGKSAVGWRLEEQAEEVNSLVQYILYGSNSASIASACSRLATIINGGALSMQQLMDIAEQEEYNEDSELPQ